MGIEVFSILAFHLPKLAFFMDQLLSIFNEHEAVFPTPAGPLITIILGSIKAS
jgi:hypothetical protein